MSAGPGHFAVLSAVVFSIGLFGVIAQQGMLRSVIAVAVLFSAPVIALAGFAQTGQGGVGPPLGNPFAVVALVAVLAETLAAAAAAMLTWRRTGTDELDVTLDAEPF